MSAATTTLTDFLLARIAEDEEVAKDAVNIESIYDNASWYWSVVNDGGSRWHPTRHDPARVLAECEAKRQIVEEHRGEFGKTGPTVTCAAHDGRYLVEDCPTLRALASVYADHPDYREEWRP